MIEDFHLISYLVYSEKIEKADAVILLEGDGYSRIKTATELINGGLADYLVFSGGIKDIEYGSFPYDMCQEMIYKNMLNVDKLIIEDRSLNTREQAENVLNMAKNRSWKSIILVASHYHQLRAFLTFLKVLEDMDLFDKVNIQNSPARGLKWFEPQKWGSRFDLLREEHIRIEKYSQKNDISSLSKVIEYYQWKESQ